MPAAPARRLLARIVHGLYGEPMTFNENADVGGNRARRRGRTAAIAGGGVAGLGGIAVLVLSLLTGGSFDLSALLGGGVPGAVDRGGDGDAVVPNCQTGADANSNDECRLAAASLNLDQYWAKQLDGYTDPDLFIVQGSTPTQCGTASNATGPFYCPPEQAVYIDPTFFGLLREQFGATAGPLAQLYVLAHEYGHHVQNLIGVMADNPDNGTGPASNGVRTELQADCFAGAWVAAATQQVDDNGVPYLQTPTEADIRDALNAAETVGDDHIQQQSGGRVNPESWTHGSSAQRERWFATGYQGGPTSCDTFSVSGGAL